MDQKDKRNEQEIKETEVKSNEKLTDAELEQVAGGPLVTYLFEGVPPQQP